MTDAVSKRCSGNQAVIGVEKRNPLGARFRNSAISRGSLARVFLPDEAEARIRDIGQRFRPAVGRPVIDDDQLKLLERLAENAVDGAANIGTLVVQRDDDRKVGASTSRSRLAISFFSGENKVLPWLHDPRGRRGAGFACRLLQARSFRQHLLRHRKFGEALRRRSRHPPRNRISRACIAYSALPQRRTAWQVTQRKDFAHINRLYTPTHGEDEKVACDVAPKLTVFYLRRIKNSNSSR